MDDLKIRNYAKLMVKKGVNIQKGQILVISSPIECADLARKAADEAFKLGAADVFIRWNDEKFSKIRYLNAPGETFKNFPDWQREFYMYYLKKGAGLLSIYAPDPEALKGVDPKIISDEKKASEKPLKEWTEAMMSDRFPWCVVSAPTRAWAKKLFPKDTEKDAFEKLWNAILKTSRADNDDPISAWSKHNEEIHKNMKKLNSMNIKSLHYKNSIGTDLDVELPENYLWLGGDEATTTSKIQFSANIPTEEIFTLPKKDGVNGTLAASKPLNYGGNLIENFSFTFKDGRIVDFKAEKGYDMLKKIIELDEGSHYLGEVSLVPYDSPISNLNMLFYNTLFDENAACHFAIGKAYPTCIKNGDKMGSDELEKIGVNDSMTHVDFMVGTKDLDIVGTTGDGKKIQIFKNGNFAF